MSKNFKIIGNDISDGYLHKHTINAGLVEAGQRVEFWTKSGVCGNILATETGLFGVPDDTYRATVDGKLRIDLKAAEQNGRNDKPIPSAEGSSAADVTYRPVNPKTLE